MQHWTQWYAYVIAAVVMVGLGFGSALLSGSGNANAWYNSLNRAPWTPPGLVFSVVWTCLYILLGIVAAQTALERAWTSTAEKWQLGVLCLTILVVLAWPLVYFKAQSQGGGVGLLALVVVLGAVYCVLAGLQHQWLRLGCFLPLLLWAMFATTMAAYPLVAGPSSGHQSRSRTE